LKTARKEAPHPCRGGGQVSAALFFTSSLGDYSDRWVPRNKKALCRLSDHRLLLLESFFLESEDISQNVFETLPLGTILYSAGYGVPTTQHRCLGDLDLLNSAALSLSQKADS
jgi:hypothetical protein